MIQTELLNKKTICHALISSTNSPEILIPIKAVIEDIHFSEDIPHYDLKVIKFYDGIDFLKKNILNRYFILGYKKKAKPVVFSKTIKSAAELENWFSDESTYRFCVESTFVVKSKEEMVSLFNKIQEFLIIQKFRSIRTSIMRPLYRGSLRIDSKVEFEQRIRRAFSDKMSDSDMNDLVNSI
jgi:hypothetical protein